MKKEIINIGMNLDESLSQLNVISVDNDFVDMSSVNILSAQHPFRDTNMKNFKKHNPTIDFEKEKLI